jgi:hypothetical protein
MKPVWCEIVCRGCSGTVAGQFTYEAIPRAAMDHEAKRQHYQYDGKIQDWFCRICWNDREDKA